jgi:hypothetical protein
MEKIEHVSCIIKVIKSRKMKWAGAVADAGEVRIAYSFGQKS